MKHGLLLPSCVVNKAAPLNRGLASWWMVLPNRLGGGGNTFRDWNGHNHGTLNGPTWGGRSHPGLRFDAVNDYVSYTNTIPFGSGDFSVVANIVRLGTAGGTGTLNNVVFQQRRDAVGTGQCAVLLFLNTSHSPAAQIRDSVGDAVTVTGTTVTSVGVPYQLALTKTSSVLRVALNGISEATSAHTLSGDFASSIDYRDFGRSRFSGADQSFFNGLLLSVSVYSRALSVPDLARLRLAFLQGYPNELNWITRPVLSGQDGGVGGVFAPFYYQHFLQGAA